MRSITSVVPIMRNKAKSLNTPIRHIKMVTSAKLMPKLPLPTLYETAERYLRSVKPLLNEKEYITTDRIIRQFISYIGDGPRLQNLLSNKRTVTVNWMNDWWLDTAYLGYRKPVIVHSSPGTVGPPFPVKCPEDVYIFAARLILAVFNYDNYIARGLMTQERSKLGPLDMTPYSLLLGTHRRPAKPKDELLFKQRSKYIIIINNNHFFKLKVDIHLTNESELTASIKDIVERSQTEEKPIGILTGNDRDTWAEDHSILLGLGNNKNILRDIETSAFVLCLDKALPNEVFGNKNSMSVRALESMTGISSHVNAGNRWHDKTIQFIVSADGFVGIEYEHSPCEGGAVAVLHDYILKDISSKENKEKGENPKTFPRAELLKFETNDAVNCAIEKATQAVDKLSEDIDLECFVFNSFGTDAVKKMQFSPDSFIQMAMQATYFKLHGRAPAHYESAGLRLFQEGRTECIRSTSIESVKFAKMMAEDVTSINKNEIKQAMISAINVHKQLAAEAVQGQGVDRHLFGLKMIALSKGMDIPELFKDVGFTRSTYFNLTSSQVPYKSASFMCYGPVVPDGYGCCYNPRPTDILFACSSFKSCKDTNTKEFANVLQETLNKMKDLASD